MILQKLKLRIENITYSRQPRRGSSWIYDAQFTHPEICDPNVLDARNRDGSFRFVKNKPLITTP